jgi:putative Ca2+/H+ antiporter (TMEM165/GDT1 family)
VHFLKRKGAATVQWNTLLVAFSLVFLSELGDKTQLAVMMLSAQHRAPAAVFMGGAAALLLSTALAVAFGEAITRLLPAATMRLIAGLAFLAMGGIFLLGRG